MYSFPLHSSYIVIIKLSLFFISIEVLNSSLLKVIFKEKNQSKESLLKGEHWRMQRIMSLLKVELILIFKSHSNITRFHLTSVLWGRITKLGKQSHILKRLILHNSVAQRTLSLQKKTSHPEVAYHAESR